MTPSECYDYVIVGAGAAGCVLANRLSEDLGKTVLVLEAGPPDHNPAIHRSDIAAVTSLWGSPEDWGFRCQPLPKVHDRAIPIAQGKVVGGGSSINALMHVRGNRRDYDQWAQMGCAGWSYNEVLPYFKKMENYGGGASRYRGTDGPLEINRVPNPTPVAEAFVQAAIEFGYQGHDFDYNGEVQENGGFFYQLTRTTTGLRCSAADAYLRPALARSNCSLVTGALVTKILLANQRAIGVEYRWGGETKQVSCSGEVLLCAGSLLSPKLLMLSGIGPADHLRRHGISVAVDLPVGENLQDHMLTSLGYACRQPTTEPCAIAEAGLFTFSRWANKDASPDLQFFCAPIQFLEPEYRIDGPAFTICPVLAKPTSVGTLRLANRDPLAAPLIDPNYLGNSRDVDVLVEGIQLGRKLVRSTAFDSFRGVELAPRETATDDDLVQYVRQTATTVWHPVGTCRMGRRGDGVVGPDLRVHTMENLRVVDASVMPIIPSGNTHAPTLMIAEKGADMILQRQASGLTGAVVSPRSPVRPAGYHSLYIGREWSVPHDRRVCISNAELRYADLGSGEPILCVHGTTVADSLITPLRFYPPLFEDYRLISYYRPGYNGSRLHQTSLSIEEGAVQIRELMDALHLEKTHILAFSFGGVIAFQFLMSYPERVHSAALLEPYLPREGEAAVKANTDAFMRARAKFDQGKKLEAALGYMEDVCGPSFLSAVEVTGPLDVWERVERCVDATFEIDFPAISAWPFRMSQADHFCPNKPNIPVLAAMGIDSESAMPGFRETQQFLMSWLPQAERAGIMNATHGMQSMNPVAVGEAVYSFFQRHPMQ
ncbi:alpha/beta fold hydrolase [Blastopirellula marina]|uniref:alpha/beta fold hydrolase n=1 Tax=Blastopirellula marina TaxID=124 RepID=UPI0018EC4034|nr:alpha/beta fold hydrolase [Blastopirellula marina]